jgi:hypothetical protein
MLRKHLPELGEKLVERFVVPEHSSEHQVKQELVKLALVFAPDGEPGTGVIRGPGSLPGRATIALWWSRLVV